MVFEILGKGKNEVFWCFGKNCSCSSTSEVYIDAYVNRHIKKEIS